jgi:hypothetical protein
MDHQAAEAALAELVKFGDTEALKGISVLAATGREYEKRRGYIQEAARYGRLQVLAESGIGKVDRATNPVQKDNPLVIEGEEIDKSTRSRWRMLGFVHDIGKLDGCVQRVLATGRTVSTYSVAHDASAAGLCYVKPAPFRREFKRRKKEGLKVQQVATASGLSLAAVRKALGLTPRSSGALQHRVHFETALRLAEVLDVDSGLFEPAPPPKVPRRRRRPRRPVTLQGGKLDKTYSLIRQALKELDSAAGSGEWGTGPAYDHLYRAEDIIAKALKRAT